MTSTVALDQARAAAATTALRRAPALLRLADRQKRGAVARLVDDAEAQIRAATRDARAEVRPLLDAFAKAYAAELERRRERVALDGGADGDIADVRVPAHWLLSSGWGKRIKAALHDAAQQIGREGLAAVRQGTRQAARKGDADAKALVAAAVRPLLDALRRQFAQISGDFTGSGALWNYVPATAPAALANNVGQYGLLFNSFGQDMTNGAELLLNLGLTGGQNPNALAGQLADLLYSSQSRGLTIARTEMLGAYRDAQLDNYRANADVVDQWMWSADKAGCCPMCLVMDGVLFPIDADMDSHVNCACSPVPQTKSWADILGPLGISAEGLNNTSIGADYESGVDWLERQPDYVQQIVLGPANFGAWQQGDMQLDDLVGRDADGQYYQRSLREQGLDARDYLGKNAVPVRDVPEVVKAGPSETEQRLADARAELQKATQAYQDTLAGGAAKYSDEAIAARDDLQRATYDAERAQAALSAEQGGRGAIVHFGQGAYTDPIERQAAFEEASQRTFGRVLTRDEIAGLVGAPKDSYVIMEADLYGERGASFSLKLHGPSWEPFAENAAHASSEYDAERLLTWDPRGGLVMNNTNFMVREDLEGQGYGVRIFSDEVRQLDALGARKIETHAAGVGDGGNPEGYSGANGYYTWPRFGYLGHIGEYPLQLLQEQAAAGEIPEAWANYTTIQQLMRTPEGRAWWKANGYESDLVFDMRPGSLSRKILNAYLKEKGLDPID